MDNHKQSQRPLVDTDHSMLVKSLAKDGQHIIDQLNPTSAAALHMVVGISGEAGELLDAIKKWVVYGKQLDVENVHEELGDLEFYLEGLRQALGIIREDTLKHNIEKLERRYPGRTYTNERAIERADKEIQ